MSAGREGGGACNYTPSVRTTSPGGNNAWGFYLGALFLAVMGLISLNDFRYALAAQHNWSPASGRVTENKVVVHHGRRSDSYHTYINYAYNAEGTEYSAGPLEIDKYKLYFTEGGAQDGLDDKFPPGKSIDVYYNPGNPYENSLGLAGAPGLAVPIVFFVLAFGAAYAGKEQY